MVAAALSAILLQLQAAQQTPPPPPADLTPDQWREAAREDIDAIHDALRDNAPFMVVDRDSASMRRWLEAGRSEALDNLSRVTDGRSYIYFLRRYVGGFRDGHISLTPTKRSFAGLLPAWPGFAMTWRHGGYQVGWVQPGMEAALPTLGAALVSCDGKSAEAVAEVRLDRMFGNLNLEAGRAAAAFQLLRDYRFPVGTPAACTFRTAAGEKTWKLAWSTPAGEVVDAAFNQLAPSRAQFGVGRWGPNGWWIGAPTMTGDDDWRALYAAIATNLDSIRASDVVVVDLRGNGGGSSEYGERLARQLFGDAVVNARDVVWGDLAFKDGPLSRQWAKGAGEKAIADKLEAAPMGSKVVIKTGGQRPPGGGSPPSPLRGRLVVLVDHACFSACLDTLDVFTRLPGVKLAGVETDADTIFMDGMRTDLPSGRATLAFGIKAWVQRARASNVPYEPDPALRYPGNLSDEAALKAWLASKLGVHGA
jgi:hypothetical protein